MPWVKGQSGNPGGRPKRNTAQFRNRLMKDLENEAREKGTTFSKHVAEQALVDNKVLIHVLKCTMPVLKAVEVKGNISGPQANIVIDLGAAKIKKVGESSTVEMRQIVSHEKSENSKPAESQRSQQFGT